MYKILSAQPVQKFFGLHECSNDSFQTVPIGQRSMTPPPKQAVIAKQFSLFGDIDSDNEEGPYTTATYSKAPFTSPERNTSSIHITPSRTNKVRGGTIENGQYMLDGISHPIQKGKVLGIGTEGVVYSVSLFENEEPHDLALKSPLKGYSLQQELRLANRLGDFESPSKKHLSVPLNRSSASGDCLLEKANGDLFDILIASGKLKEFLQGPSEDSLKLGFMLHTMQQLLIGVKGFHLGTEHIHCDIKLENILHADSRRLLLHDFGSAKSADGNKADGTPAYASPESMGIQVRDLGITEELSPKSDVFSLGAVFCKLITGKEYFKLPTETCVHAPLNEPEIEIQLVQYLKTIHPKVLSKETPLAEPACSPLQGLLETVVFPMLEVQPRNRSTVNTVLDSILPQWESLKTADHQLEDKIKGLWQSWVN